MRFLLRIVGPHPRRITIVMMVMAAGILERRQLGEITFAQWLTPGLVVAVSTPAIANLPPLLQLPRMPQR